MTGQSSELNDKEYVECFDLFKTVSTEWDALECWLREEFIPVLKNDNSIDILTSAIESPYFLISSAMAGGMR